MNFIINGKTMKSTSLSNNVYDIRVPAKKLKYINSMFFKRQVLKQVYVGEWWNDIVDNMSFEELNQTYKRLENSPKIRKIVSDTYDKRM